MGPPKGTRIGGRQKGTPNKVTQQVREIVASVFADQKEAEQWKKLLDHKDPRIAFEAFKLALAYKHGRPTGAVKIEPRDGYFFGLGEIAEEALNDDGDGEKKLTN